MNLTDSNKGLTIQKIKEADLAFVIQPPEHLREFFLKELTHQVIATPPVGFSKIITNNLVMMVCNEVDNQFKFFHGAFDLVTDHDPEFTALTNEGLNLSYTVPSVGNAIVQAMLLHIRVLFDPTRDVSIKDRIRDNVLSAVFEITDALFKNLPFQYVLLRYYSDPLPEDPDYKGLEVIGLWAESPANIN